MKTNMQTRRLAGRTDKGLMLAAMVALAALAACGRSPAPEAGTGEKPAATSAVLRVVDVMQAVPLATADSIEMNGVLAFREETRAAFKTGGVVGRIAVREGDVVKAGAVLAALDAAEIDAGVAQAQALHEKAVRDLKRGETLRAQEVIAQEVLDNLQTAEQAARASLQAARFNRGTAELRAAEAVVVIKRVSEPGEVVGPGQPVLLLGSLKSGLVFRGGLNDAQRVRLAASGKAAVKLDAWPGDLFDASILEVGQAADARTGGYRVELGVSVPSGKTLLAGMVGRAQLPAQLIARQAWVLPLSSVVETTGDQVAVYAVQDGDVVKRLQFPLLQLRRDSVVVGGDIAAGQRFVSSGTSYLSDGDTVRINRLTQGATP